MRPRSRLLYGAAAYLLVPLVTLVMLWRGWRDRGYWHNFAQRFGFGRTLALPSIWVHAVSVGEVQAAAALIRNLVARYPGIPLVLTTATPTGAQRARALFTDHVDVRFVPFDLPGAARRFFTRVRPRLAVIFETELWPNLYHECHTRRVPLVLASARISPRSVRRYRRLLGIFADTLSQGVVIAAQAPGDAERFRAVGAPAARTHVTGNLKFDFTVPAEVIARGRELRAYHAPGRGVWVAGSTHAGEEEILLDAQRRLQRSPADALLVLVPRHPPRFAEVAAWLARERVSFVKVSQRRPCDAATAVLLVDSLGELLDFYAAGDVAFVGGSLVPVGGHNLLEPAALGLPILAGPHSFNSTDIAQLLIARGALEVVRDAAGLAERLAALLSDPAERARRGELARASIEDNRGALEKLLRLIDPVLQGA
ncbi:MAG TPA: lipid IV(A) 3-deoxy-D-manno-octulosonic acid transferase [Steroidobacteraceae bacterium]|jgi:3-deoxy-D-manno-octulosonic-acid transferase|nr:lipid IV(A) 3-deoxy-D-manno-octulosonic acid transferase [Steroidobacteraceae bacterium]